MVDGIFLITGYAAIASSGISQIEVQNDPETIKYGLGQKIVIKTKQNDEMAKPSFCAKVIYETGCNSLCQGMLQV